MEIIGLHPELQVTTDAWAGAEITRGGSDP